MRTVTASSPDAGAGAGHEFTDMGLAHIHAHVGGGPYDLRNIVLLCGAHHTLFDAGRLVFLGWSENEHPIFEKRPLRPGKGPRAPPDG